MTRVAVAASNAVVRAGLEVVVRSSASLELVPDAGAADVLLIEREELPEDTFAPAVHLTEGRSSARGVLPKDATPAQIVAAIEAVAAGLLVSHPDSAGASGSPGDALTARETEVLRMIADGAPNKNIAWKLGISEHTVKFHVSSIMAKLGAASRTEAVNLGARRGLITL